MDSMGPQSFPTTRTTLTEPISPTGTGGASPTRGCTGMRLTPLLFGPQMCYFHSRRGPISAGQENGKQR